MQPMVCVATADDVDQLVRLRHAMFTAMASEGSAARPEVADDASWYPAARRELIAGLVGGTRCAFVVDLNATAAAAPLYRSLGFAAPRLAALRRLGETGQDRSVAGTCARPRHGRWPQA